MKKTVTIQKPIDVDQKPIDNVEAEVRALRENKDAANKESVDKRMDPKFIQEMYSGLKKEVDYVNSKPENKKYLEDYLKTKVAYEKRGSNVIDLLKEGLKTINIPTTTGKPKGNVEVKERPVDYNNADIDGRGVYILLSELGLIKEERIDESGTKSKGILGPKYLQGNVKGKGKEEATEGLSINEGKPGEGYGLGVQEDDVAKRRKARDFIRSGKNPFENSIIAINNNIKHSDGPTSSTRMIYEILKTEGLIRNLSPERQQQMEKFVYFVDIAYRLKQRVIGMDFPYVGTTIFGNYKNLNVYDIFDYLEDPTKTGFELINTKEAKKIHLDQQQMTNGKKQYIETDLLTVLRSKSTKTDAVMEGFNKVKDNVLLYNNPEDTAHKQDFIFDIGERINFAEDLAGFVASGKLGFCKIHPNNQIFIRSYYDLPNKFGPFKIESGNTFHGDLTDDNIEGFLKMFEGKEEIKQKIRAQFIKNKGAASTPNKLDNISKLPNTADTQIGKGSIYKGVITKKADFGMFIQITKGSNNNAKSGLLHKSQVNINKYEEGNDISVIINDITPKGISFGLAPTTIDDIKMGQRFSGTVDKIDKGIVYIKINGSNLTGTLVWNVPKKLMENSFNIGSPIAVKVIKKEKGIPPVFETIQAL